MKRLVLFTIVFGSFLACAAAVVLTTVREMRSIARSPEARASQLSCGHWCVYRCSWMLGAPVDTEDVVRLLPPKSGGHTLLDLKDALNRIGFQARGYREPFAEFCGGEFPAIVHLKEPDHFVLALGRLKTGILVFDASGRRRRLTQEMLRERWTGNVLRVWKRSDGIPLPQFKARDKTAGPCLQFQTLHADKGDVPIGQEVASFVFPFSNLGSTPLVIQDVQTDCSCLQVEKPDRPVGPGDDAKIVLTYHTRAANRKGVFQHEAVVRSNDPAYPFMPLRVSGNTDVRVTFAPPVIDFGTIVRGRSADAFCFVRYIGEDVGSFQLRDVRCSVDGVLCRELTVAEYKRATGADKRNPKSASPRGHTRILELSYEPAARSGETSELSGTLEFNTSIDGLGTISVPITAHEAPPVIAVPASLDFGELCGDSDGSASAFVTLHSRVRRPFRVLKLEPASSEGPFEFALENGRGDVTLKVVCDEKVALANHKATLGIHLQVEDDRESFVLPVVMYAWNAAATGRTSGRLEQKR